MRDDLIERNTHLIDWLSDGWTHCQHGTKEWCEAYIHNARDVIKSQDAALAAKDEQIATLVQASLISDELHTAKDEALSEIRAELERVKKALGPFSSAAGYLANENGWSDSDEIELCYDDGIRISVIPLSAFRAAARALAPSTQDTSERHAPPRPEGE